MVLKWKSGALGSGPVLPLICPVTYLQQVTSTFLNLSFSIYGMEGKMLRLGSYFSGYFLREPDKKLQALLPKMYVCTPKFAFTFPLISIMDSLKPILKDLLRLLYTL